MPANKEKTFIFVIGMHRSGTSLVANLLEKAGVFLGESDDLLPPNFDNRYGFYEHKDFLKINDRVLEKFGLYWDSTKAPDFNKDIDLKKEKEIANKFLKELISEHNIIAFKDPRATLTLPFWKEIIDGDIKILFVKRNPLEISDSLKKRNSFSKEKSLSIWENYERAGLENIKGLDALFVNYDDILNNPFPNFVRMLKFLDIEYDEDTLKKMYFTIDPDVRHSEYSNEDIMEDKDVTKEQKDLLRELDKRYEEQLKKYPLEEVNIKVTLEEKNDHLRKKISDMGRELDKSRKNNVVKETEVESIQKEVEKIKISKEKLLEERNKLKEENTKIKAEKEKLLKEKNKLKEENTKIKTEKEKLFDEKNKLRRESTEIKLEKEKLFDEKNKLSKENAEIKIKKEKIEKECQELRPDAQEFRTFKQTKIWKALTIYRKFKKYFKNFFINIFRDGPILTFKRIFKRIGNTVQYRINLKKERDPYKYWVKQNRITWRKRRQISSELRTLEYKPLISIVMPVYNVDVKWIKEAVKSIKNQIYSNWELCIADDASTNPELIKYLKSLEKDPKIKITFRKKNGHISEASNTALELVEGEFVALMDNDDIIHPHALAEVVKVLNKKKDTDLIYSDEDKIDMEGKRVEPFFKPDWSPDFFLSVNYLSHLTVIRKKLIDTVGGFRKGYEGSQDYDLFLRVTEETENIEHVSDILYSWRKIPGSTATNYGQKGYANKTSTQALEDTIKRRKLDATVENGVLPGVFRVKYKIKGNPLVSIIIPTLDKYRYIERCISSLFDKTTYNNFEVIVIDTGSTDKKTLEYYKTIENNPKIRFLDWNEKFNYSSVNNYGVENARGEYILLLNNDTEIISPDWIENLLGHAQREQVGAVGAKLYYPNDTIQHAGVILGTHGGAEIGAAGHAFLGLSKDLHPPSLEQKSIIRNYSAVTAACLMINKKKFCEVNGLDENFRIAFNDVDFCLKLRAKGYYNVYNPYVELYHHESVSVGTPEKGTRDMNEFVKEVKMLNEKWRKWILNDPFYNKNLSLITGLFQVKVDK